MKDENQEIKHESTEKKYFHMMLNMADDDLDPYEYRLLGHYVRLTKCFESTRTTAEKCKMSIGKVAETRRTLQDKGYIKIDENKTPLHITIIDRWFENVQRYQNPKPTECSPHEQQCSPHERHLIKNSLKKKKESAPTRKMILNVFDKKQFGAKLTTGEIAKALDYDKNVFAIFGDKNMDFGKYHSILHDMYLDGTLLFNDNKDGQREYWLKEQGETKTKGNDFITISAAIERHWKIAGGWEKDIAHMLLGSSKKNGYKDYSEQFKDEPVTLAEIQAYPAYCKAELGDECALPKAPAKIANYIINMRKQTTIKQDDSWINLGG